MLIVKGELEGNHYQMMVADETHGLKVMNAHTHKADKMELVLDGSVLLFEFNKENNKGIVPATKKEKTVTQEDIPCRPKL